MLRKKRVLYVSEFSGNNTGFSVIGQEILTRLWNTNKYELAELGSYVRQNDPRLNVIPWKCYGVMPDGSDEQYTNVYNTDMYAQFGKQIFESVCLDFKPDIVIDIRDIWHSSEWQLKSPFRNYFKYMYMPTIDGFPQRLPWLEDYRQSDLILTYSQFAKDVLAKECPDVSVFDVARPGVNHEIFKPLNKKELRKKFKLAEDAKIIITVMRNQKRKLFPNLMKSFRDFLDKCLANGQKEIYDNAYLLLFTGYPDVGYDLSRFVLEYDLGQKCLFPYMCRNCGHYWIDKFKSEITTCPNCGNVLGHMPNCNVGVTRHQLAEYYNIADFYVQYSICLAKGQEIFTSNGWKPIEQVQKGEFVLTHQNRFKPVSRTFVNHYNNNMQEISIHGDYEKLKITDNHPVYAYTKQNCCPTFARSLREWIGLQISKNKELPEPKFVNVADLKNGDIIAKIINPSINNIETIDLADFATERDIVLENTITIKGGHSYPRYIEIDDDFCQLLGLFAADGNSSKSTGCVKITCNLYDTNNIELAKNVFRKISGKEPGVRKYKDRNALDIICNSSIINKFFMYSCYNANEKCLPSWTETLSIERQAKIIYGMFMGDGHEGSRHNIIESVYCTISKKLADQLKNMLERHKITHYSSLINKKCNDKKNRKPQYMFYINGKLKTEFSPTCGNKQPSRNTYYKNYRLLNIKNIVSVDYTDNYVYNIEVEDDNSYMTRLGVVHNCEGLSCPLAEAKSCGLPVVAVNHTAMKDHLLVDGTFQLNNFKLFHESVMETEQERALPDNNELVEVFTNFFQTPKDTIDKWAKIVRQDAIDNFSFDRAAKIFERAIDSIDIYNDAMTWNNPNGTFAPANNNVPNHLSNAQLIDWCIENIIGANRYWNNNSWKSEMAKALNVGQHHTQNSRQEMNKSKFVQMCLGIAFNINFWEKRRLDSLKQNNNTMEVTII